MDCVENSSGQCILRTIRQFNRVTQIACTQNHQHRPESSSVARNESSETSRENMRRDEMPLRQARPPRRRMRAAPSFRHSIAPRERSAAPSINSTGPTRHAGSSASAIFRLRVASISHARQCLVNPRQRDQSGAGRALLAGISRNAQLDSRYRIIQIRIIIDDSRHSSRRVP